MLSEVLLAGVVAVAVLADVYDVTLTERGLKAGVAVESFDWLVGEKPTAKALYLRDLGIIAVCSAPSLAMALIGNPAGVYMFLSIPAVACVKHILGGRAWSKLLKK